MYLLRIIAGLFISLLMIGMIVITSIFSFSISLIIWVFTFPFDKKRIILHRLTCYCLAFWAYMMPTWRIKVEGREKIRKGEKFMIIANHQSQLDIMMSALLFADFKWVSKAEILKVPVLGWQMALNKYITIKRGYVNSISRMMTDCEKAIETGSSVLLFPEGSRSESGEIKEFKPGAFILAEKQKLPVIPVVIYGTKDALPKNSFVSFGTHQICIKVLDEISYSELAKSTPDENAEKARVLIEQHYNIIKKRIELNLY